MSISTQLARIQASRDTIRTKLVELGLAAPDAQLDALATVISEIANQGAVSIEIKENTSYTIPAGYHNGSGIVKAITDIEGDAERYLLQIKTIAPTEAEQAITSDDGYYGLESVTVLPIPESYVKPEGIKEIIENGTHDVKTYESVSVNVPKGEDLNEVLAEQDELIETLRTTLEGKAAGGGDGLADQIVDGSATEVVLPNATKVRMYAFYRMKGLTNISMPNVTSIG